MERARYADCLLYTAKGTEFETVKTILEEKNKIHFEQVGPAERGLLVGTLDEGNIRIVLATGSRQGPEVCAATVTALLYDLEPRRIIMVGMCAGESPKYKLGDALFGVAAVNIDEGKIIPSGEFLVDNRSVQAHEVALVMGDRLETQELGYSVTFMSGGAVIENGTIPWGKPGRPYHAYDMEASAFLTAVQHFNTTGHNVVALGVCKGIADGGDSKTRAVENKQENQRIAVEAATSAVVQVLKWLAQGEQDLVNTAFAYATATDASVYARTLSTYWKSELMTLLNKDANEGEDKRIATGHSDGDKKYVRLVSRKQPVKNWTMKQVKGLFDDAAVPTQIDDQVTLDELQRGKVKGIEFSATGVKRARMSSSGKVGEDDDDE